MENLNFITPLHTRGQRNYVGRVTEDDKSECATLAKQWGKDYWDGDRKHGYGGYKYDGRWSTVAEKMIDHYQLPENASILDIGCGKGFLLYELKKCLPNAQVCGVDISTYGVENSKEEIRDFVKIGNATQLEFPDNSFDLVISVTTFHNLYIYDLKRALQEFERVKKNHGYISVESYRNEREKMNLLYWQLTCESFYTPEEWIWFYKEFGYTGDYEFIYFE